MFNLFEATTADAAWQMIAAQFRSGKNVAKAPSRAGLTHEIARGVIAIANPRQRWVTSRYPAINPAFALAEVVWIVRGRKDSAFLTYFNSELPRYAGSGPTFHGAYGFRLREHLGLDQLDRAFRAFRAKPYSRQVVLQIWDSHIDLPTLDGAEAAPDVPCNVISMLKLRNSSLEWVQVLRSSDVYRGLPYNLVQFTMIHEILAGWLDVETGVHNQLTDSLHVYDDCLDHVLNSGPIEVSRNLDSLAMPRRESEEAFQELEVQVERIIDRHSVEEEIVSIAHSSGYPDSIKNVLLVLCAEGLRRRRRIDLAEGIMAQCTNPCYRQLVARWFARVAKR